MDTVIVYSMYRKQCSITEYEEVSDMGKEERNTYKIESDENLGESTDC